MASPLLVALIKPNQQLAEAVEPLLQRAGLSVTLVDDVYELFGLPMEQIERFDAVLVPLRLESGSTGVSSCVEIRSHEMFRRLPIIGLCITRESRVIESFHEVGADAVYTTPFDSDAIIAQVRALSRRSHVYEREVEPEGAEMLVQLSACMHALPEAIILLDTKGKLFFGNDRARVLFDLDQQIQADDVVLIEEFLTPLLDEHKRQAGYEQGKTSWHRRSFSAASGSIPLAISIAQLADFHPEARGYCVQLKNAADLEWIENSFAQLERLRASLSLSQACLTEFLPKTGSGILVSPLQRIEEVIAKTSKSCSLNAVATSLMEFMDVVLSPHVTVRVSGVDLTLALRAADLMQLLGHMLLIAADFCGEVGEIGLEATDHVPGEGITVMLTAVSKKPASRLPESSLSELIQNKILRLEPASDSHSAKISGGIEAAQKLATSMRTELQYQENPGVLKMRVRLPADLK